MNNTKFNKHHKSLINQLLSIFLMLGFTAQMFLSGCASVNRKEGSIHTILQKENALIEKLKVERAQPEITQALEASDTLKKAEAHLSLSLDELLKANEVIRHKILKQQPKEVEGGENERAND